MKVMHLLNALRIVALTSFAGIFACGEATAPVEEAPSGRGPASPQLALGGVHSCLLGTSGHAVCWGRYGANPSVPTQISTPTQITPADGSIKFVSITAGTSSCGLTAEGRGYCWGTNLYGQLGDGTVAAHAEPKPIATSSRFREIDAGLFATCGIDASGFTLCWGSGDYGVLGAGLKPEGSKQLTPAPVSGNAALRSLTGSFVFCAIAQTNAVYCWGTSPGSLDLSAFVVQGDCASSFYVAFTGRGCAVPTAVPNSSMLSSLSKGNNGMTVCGLDAAGIAYCWGEGSFGTLGNNQSGPGVHAISPVPVSTTLRFKDIASAGSHVCALALGGAAYCWGNNFRGTLGSGTSGGGSPIPLAVAGGHQFVSIAAGSTHTCALKANGEVWCWGVGTEGQLGQRAGDADSNVPVKVDLSTFPSI